MTLRTKEDWEAWRRACVPGTTSWDAILPYLVWSAQGTDVFNAMRDFVSAARSEPPLANRYIYPSRIALTIFERADPVGYDDAHLHPRVVVGPYDPRKVRVRYFEAQKEKPELIAETPIPDEPGKMKLRVWKYIRGEPVPRLEWIGEPREAFAFIERCFKV